MLQSQIIDLHLQHCCINKKRLYGDADTCVRGDWEKHKNNLRCQLRMYPATKSNKMIA